MTSLTVHAGVRRVPGLLMSAICNHTRLKLPLGILVQRCFVLECVLIVLIDCNRGERGMQEIEAKNEVDDHILSDYTESCLRRLSGESTKFVRSDVDQTQKIRQLIDMTIRVLT